MLVCRRGLEVKFFNPYHIIHPPLQLILLSSTLGITKKSHPSSKKLMRLHCHLTSNICLLQHILFQLAILDSTMSKVLILKCIPKHLKREHANLILLKLKDKKNAPLQMQGTSGNLSSYFFLHAYLLYCICNL